MSRSKTKCRIVSLTIVAALAGGLFLTACGGSDNSTEETTGQAQAGAPNGAPGGGLFANLTETQQQCLEDAGITLPEGPPGDGGTPPTGEPPEGMNPPAGGPPQGGEGMPGMEGMRTAMEECDIDLADPPEGGMPTTDDAAF